MWGSMGRQKLQGTGTAQCLQRTGSDAHTVHGGDVHGKHTLTFASGALHTLVRPMRVQGSGVQDHKCHCPQALCFHAFMLSCY